LRHTGESPFKKHKTKPAGSLREEVSMPLGQPYTSLRRI
jgi:hypothetical protein